jgi:hypothetical protein
MKQIQNNQKSRGKSLPAFRILKSQEKNPRTKSRDTFAICLSFVAPYGMVVWIWKYLEKLACGFFFFGISISKHV